MKKIIKLFINIKSEQDWLAKQKGLKLIKTNGLLYTFEESSCEYNYEYIYFEKSKKELLEIKNQITDKNIEFVCNSWTWALFRKDASKGDIQVYADNYSKYKILMNHYHTYLSLGACYLCIGLSQAALATRLNIFWWIVSLCFCLCSLLYFMTSSSFKKYALEYDDGTYSKKMKKENLH